MEIESGIVDFQAQFRPAQLQRDALSQRLGRTVRLIIAVNDTESVRARLADLLHRAGQRDDAMAELKQAVAIFAEIGQGVQPEELQPEMWKLVEW